MLKFLKYTAFVLVIIGALNWGLVGFFKFDLVAFLFGEMTVLTRIVYDLVGISAIVSIIAAINCHNEHEMQ